MRPFMSRVVSVLATLMALAVLAPAGSEAGLLDCLWGGGGGGQAQTTYTPRYVAPAVYYPSTSAAPAGPFARLRAALRPTPVFRWYRLLLCATGLLPPGGSADGSDQLYAGGCARRLHRLSGNRLSTRGHMGQSGATCALHYVPHGVHSGAVRTDSLGHYQLQRVSAAGRVSVRTGSRRELHNLRTHYRLHAPD